MADAVENPEHETPFAQVPVEITVCVGKARPRIRELLDLSPDAVLPLDRNIDDPVELYVGQRLIARGILEETEEDGGGRLAVRLTEVAKGGVGL